MGEAQIGEAHVRRVMHAKNGVRVALLKTFQDDEQTACSPRAPLRGPDKQTITLSNMLTHWMLSLSND